MSELLKKNLNIHINDPDEDEDLYEYKFKSNDLNKLIPRTKKEAIKKGIKLYSVYARNLEEAARNKSIICLLANKFCTIIYGEPTKKQKQEGVYSLKKFANDIGMPPGTLRAWMEAFRNINLVLEEATPEEEDWIFPDAEKRKIIYTLKRENGVNSKTSKKDVVKAAIRHKNMSFNDRKLARLLTDAIAIQHFLVDKQIDSLDKGTVRKLRNVLNKCLFHLGGE